LIPPSEAHRLLVELNHTSSPLPQDLCIHNLFESRAESAPSALAAVCNDESLTYQGLNARANQLANYLQSAGVGCETIVAICLGRSLDLLVALLAVLKSGGAYLPLDRSQPAERLAFMVEDAGAIFVLTDQSMRALFETGGAAVICLDRAQDIIDHYPNTNPRSSVGPDNLAYVLYTSGSTGTPKGVLVSHRPLVNHSLAVAKTYGLNPADRVLQFASIGFDVAAEEIFPSWHSGAAVVLRDEDAAGSPLDLLRLIARRRLTVVNLPSSYWHELVSEMSRAGNEIPGSVRLMIVGSERALPEKYNSWRSLTGGRVRLCNAYGPTETTITATIYPAGETGFPAAATLPIGRPIANTRVYLLDAFMQPCPAGVPGELYIGGAGLARGYHGRPDLTASSFVPDLFGDEPGGRLYKTGDRARYLPDGELEFLGRADQQVKVRGFRIEPGEVEAGLALHPLVREAVVLTRDDPGGGLHLVGYVVVSGRDENLDSKALREFLKESLPDYMLPSRIITLAELPLTSSGKIDRRTLSELSGPGAEAERAITLPRNPVEEILLDIWREVLGLENIGVEDNFFELGGHSLLAMRLISKVRGAFQTEIRLRSLFDSPTIGALAREISELGRTGNLAPADPIKRHLRDSSLPLSYAQQRMWFLDRLAPGNATYIIPTAMRIKGRLDVEAFTASLRTVVARHESLRTSFAVSDDQPVQIINDVPDPILPVVDLSGLESGCLEAEVSRQVERDAREPFDLEGGPLFRAKLLRLGDEDSLV
ncbi:MAG TPA: amino acid adenylation domain-containing protein, partial [Blastocatellia bacterium]|nr:amino acid adenylation domain-containing protein [Blastocatellia bacterium]